MPRKARVDAVGALQHIIIRGIERRKIFRDDGDRNNFLERLGNILSDIRTQCYAYPQVRLEAQGYNLEKVIERVSMLLNIVPKEIMRSGKYPQVVAARSLVCYWANRELGMTTIELAQRFNLSQPTISKSVKRGEMIAIDNGFKLISDANIIKE